MKLKVFLFVVAIASAFKVFGRIDAGLVKSMVSDQNLQLPSVIVVLPTKDCYKCIVPVSQLFDLLSKAEIDANTHLLIVSDNYSFAKGIAEDFNIKCKIKPDLDFVHAICPDQLARIILIASDSIQAFKVKEIDEQLLEHINSKFQNRSNPKSSIATITIADSLFTKDFLAFRHNCDYFLFDNLLQKGMVWDSITTTYLKVDFDDSLIYHHLLNQFNDTNLPCYLTPKRRHFLKRFTYHLSI